MTPKEKAQDLVEKFMPYSDYLECDVFTQRENQLKNAKECALICVDEILKTNPMEKNSENHGHRGMEIWYEEMSTYWQETKQEIEKL